MKPLKFFKWAILDANSWNLIAERYNKLEKEINELNYLILFLNMGNLTRTLFEELSDGHHLELGQKEMLLNLKYQGYLK